MKPLILIHKVCGWCSITKSFIARRKLCPKCGTQITDNTSVCVFLPDPFISTTTGCCSILLKPSVNSFSKYKLGDDLHIGLSNSKGFVFSYTNNGIVVESHWNDCLCIYRFSDNKTYDIRMKMFVSKYHSRFTHKHYDKKNWNCYDFVVEFLLDAGVLQRTSHVKDEFVAEHVCKPLQRVLRYYSLLDRLSRSQANFLTLS